MNITLDTATNEFVVRVPRQNPEQSASGKSMLIGKGSQKFVYRMETTDKNGQKLIIEKQARCVANIFE